MVAAIIQARMSSTRLPGKVLMLINGKPMLMYMVERVLAALSIDKVIIITSTDSSDDPIAQLCEKNKFLLYRGSLEDVLERYYQAAVYYKVDTVVRLTADCPLLDPDMIDKVVAVYKEGKYDYVGNTIPPKWSVPVGMDVEVFSFEKLAQLSREVKNRTDREHVTFYLWKNPDIFKIYRYENKEDLSRFRLTVDYKEDFELVKA
ncbi:MAG: glycosyltransferase family protein, partial [Candidatus Omnitrophota bacterium]